MNRRATASLLGLVLALPFASWWVIGDRSEPGERQYLDFMVEPPRLSSNQQLLVGLVAVFVCIATTRSLVAAWRQGGIPREALLPGAVLVLAAVGLGWAVRVVTAGTIGANIGGGLLLLVAPFAGAAVVVAVVRLLTLRADQPGTGTALV